MAVTCVYCRGPIRPRLAKIALALGGTAAMIPLAALFGLKAGIVALGIATMKGNRDAAKLLQIKIKLAQASERMGAFFFCEDCGKDASVSHVFGQIFD